jgi:transcriptional regulator with XRE-family HTH domain
MAKADLRKTEIEDFRPVIGGAIQRMQDLAGLSLKELADLVGRDERQVKRWKDGSERPQFDALWSVASLRGVLVQALAELAQDVEVITEIRVRRRTA